MAKALRIARIGLAVPNLDAACAFYETALGFTPKGEETRSGPEFEAFTGLRGVRARLAILRLGEQEIELAAFEPAGKPYAQPPVANAPGFQHFAIAVSDMGAAYTRLAGTAQTPISQGGPQRLPPSTGSVTAFKFRDPDAHPLELSLIPHSHWLRGGGAGAFLGIDHTALAVSDLEISTAFYRDLIGLQANGRGFNHGPEQDRLDGLPEVALDIGVLEFAGGGPHIELLRYRSPKPPPGGAPAAVHDVAASRTLIEVADLDAALARLAQAQAAFVSSQPVVIAGRPRVMLRDPDGHLLELIG